MKRIGVNLARVLIAIGLLSAAVAIGRWRISPFDWHYRPLMLAGSGVVVAASLGVLLRRTLWLLIGAIVGVAPVLWRFKDAISSAIPL